MQQLQQVRREPPTTSAKSQSVLKRVPIYKPLFCSLPDGRFPSGPLFPGRSRAVLRRHSVLSTTFRGFLPLILLLLFPSGLFAQEIESEGENLFQRRPFTGSLSLTTEYRSTDREESYSPSGGNLFGFVSLEGQFASARIPLDVTFSTEENIQGDSYLRIGVHPEFFGGRVKFDVGDFYADASGLTLGNASLFGVSGSVEGGKFRGGLWYGSVERPTAFSSDTLQAEPTRTAVGGRVGLGTNEGGFFDLTMSRIMGGEVSHPEENLLVGGEFFLPLFGRNVMLRGEGVITAWSSDLAAEEVETDLPLFTARESSQFDGAGSLELCYAPSGVGSIGIRSRWIGPGYVNLAQPYSRNDIFEATLSPSLTLFDGRIYTSGSIGVEWDNLRQTKEGRTTQIVGSLFASARPTSAVNLSLSYNDFGVNSDHANDTVRYGYLSRSLAFSPTFYWNGLGGVQVGSVNASLQVGKTRSAGGDFIETSVRTLDATWSLTLPSMLSLTSGIGYSATGGADYQTEVFSARQTLSHVLLRGRFSGSITLGLSHYRTEGGIHFDLSSGVAYDLGLPGILSLTFSNSVDNGFGSQANRELYGALRYGLRL